MLQCPICGSDVAADGVLCPECGTQLEPLSTPSVAPARPQNATLILMRDGKMTDVKFELRGRLTIGRSEQNSDTTDIDLSELPEAVFVSRRHATIWMEADGSWRIEDLDSRNGTYLRSHDGKFGRILKVQPMQSGDEIALGKARFKFQILS